MDVRIGTSGWTYPHWQKAFFPEDLPHEKRLRFYAERFSSVEINTTFYGLPSAATVSHWSTTVPKSFRFAVKASRYTTHRKKLLAPRKSTEKFFSAIKPLKKQIVAVLFQLPPRFRCNAERLKAFLEKMPRDYRYAFEFRDPSWFQPEVYAILEKHNAALCLYDFRGRRAPDRVTADFVYVRLHGPQSQAYRGSYPLSGLRTLARKISNWERDKKDVFVYFDNDEKGYAPVNARKLANLMESAK